ncbi:hypothetical protein [Mucilaginibacter arboris]|uniref:Uncharacterized protein n=1 Tax=Mucilaginibacter arboris TaxID=2682090 RepID=A0A7K1T1S0_9SPHI|nr:hypothetical protein [Mucilaginibacter arboris]MVN23468.1 hypothetical protein [Mucilaginibacter arboris]
MVRADEFQIPVLRQAFSVSGQLKKTRLQNKTMEDFLNILIEEKLSSVTFVMDYLQVDFDGNGFTFYIWPVVTVENIEYKFGDSYYRDKLCSLIAQIVKSVSYVDNKEIVIHFDNENKLFLSLDPNNPDIIVEIATFKDANKNWYVFQ